VTQTRLSFGPPESLRRVAQGLEYDEMVSGDGLIRSNWRPIVGAFHAIEEGAFVDRAARACREIREASLSHDSGTGPRPDVSRPFDLLPMLLPAVEWAALEAGMVQRARLFDRILDDLYGPRDLVARRLVPAPLVYANPRYLRPCAGMTPRGWVQCYAADLVRGGDGTWRVVADRLQSPAGIGGALQNRELLARIVPEFFRAHPVRRIEPFFEVWRAALAGLAPRGVQPPRIVVVTPGPFNAAYYEHLYLARQLGAALVEGADLTVRDGRVCVKTLGALQAVDVILRFVEDDYCDPLELRGDSVLGITGLVQAVRSGQVVVANALGASLVETPALRPSLPALAEHLLGESLLLDAVETEWLGAPGALERFDSRADWTVLPAFAHRRAAESFALEAARAGRPAMLERIRGERHLYVAERPVRPSVIPIWTPGGLVPRPLALRLFVIRAGDGFVAMPGGLSQVADERVDAAIPLVPPLTAKDTWVLASESEPSRVMPAAAPVPVAIQRPSDDLRSRTADDLYWLGRYTERLDNAARILRSAVQRLAVERFGRGQREETDHLVRVLVEQRLLPPGAVELLADGTGLHFLIAETCSNGTALNESLRAVKRIAQTLRDRLSLDTWKIVLRLLHDAGERLVTPPHHVDRMLEAFDEIIGLVAAFGGMASENMTRVTGWRFLDVGRRLERGIYAASVLKELAADGGEPALSLILELCDSSITYRSRYLGVLQAGPVIDLVLADETNPRGVAFQLRIASQRLGEIAASFGRPQSGPDRLAVDSILEAIRGFRLAALDDPEDRGARHRLVELLSYARGGLVQLSDTIQRSYFSHIKLPHAVGYAWTKR
jgi:uncharacterized circularly permuted ATP-grasp superfamily protein/uncharacterized alpha-E superfamily protein